MFLILLVVSTVTLLPKSVMAATRTTNPRATTYRPYLNMVGMPVPATLLSEIPCMKICELEVAACMQVCLLLWRGSVKVMRTR
jgi:hypothetical protein